MNAVVDVWDAPSFAVTISGQNKPNGLSVSKELCFTAAEWTKLKVSYGTYKFILREDVYANVGLFLGTSYNSIPLIMNTLEGVAGDELFFDLDCKDHDYFGFVNVKHMCFSSLHEFDQGLINNVELVMSAKELNDEQQMLNCDLEVTLFFKL
jgi:hypothetical protein